MLTRFTIRNFKRFEEIELELGSPVVFVGPNNSGKTTALQALALWDLGVKRWVEKRGIGAIPAARPGVTINRRDLLALPVPDAKLLWRELHVRDVERDTETKRTKRTRNILIELLAEGVADGRPWSCGIELDYANSESVHSRPLRLADGEELTRMPIPEAASKVRIAHLQPMSGLSAAEARVDRGRIDVLMGEGKTAEVLRNLCYLVSSDPAMAERWPTLTSRVETMFGVQLQNPTYVPERGELVMTYRERGSQLDISSAGRGLQQIVLLLAYLAANPGAVILVDEPDAHLEILRQREVYRLLTEATAESGSQVIMASHSEVILNEAADQAVVVAFVGKPHRIDDRGSQVLKALKEIGYDQYLQAEINGWVLYLEGSTDLAILTAFAERLRHPAAAVLRRPFVHYVANQPQRARDHFFGLREAKADLVGLLLCDRLERSLEANSVLVETMWQRREIENYLCSPETLEAFAASEGFDSAAGPLFSEGEAQRRRDAMRQSIEYFVPPVALENPADAWWQDTKVSDEFLDRLFPHYYGRLGLPNLMAKSDYHQLAPHVPENEIAPEIVAVLDRITEVAQRARPG